MFSENNIFILKRVSEVKKILALLLICMSVILPPCAYAGNSSVTVLVNGKEIVSDVPPQLVNGRTFLPMRAVFEALGANVTWIPADRMIFAAKGGTLAVFQADIAKMTVQGALSGDKTIILDAPPFIVDGRTMIPVRAAAEAFNADVTWDESSRTVTVSTCNSEGIANA